MVYVFVFYVPSVTILYEFTALLLGVACRYVYLYCL